MINKSKTINLMYNDYEIVKLLNSYYNFVRYA